MNTPSRVKITEEQLFQAVAEWLSARVLREPVTVSACDRATDGRGFGSALLWDVEIAPAPPAQGGPA